jgi:hypothetical protein
MLGHRQLRLSCFALSMQTRPHLQTWWVSSGQHSGFKQSSRLADLFPQQQHGASISTHTTAAPIPAM